MSSIATATIGGVVLGAYASSNSSSAAEEAAETQADSSLEAAQISADAQLEAANLSADTQKEFYYQSREDTAPWRDAGANALTQLQDKVSAGPGQFDPKTDPGYEFGYKNFIENPTLAAASATGRLRSGATQKALARYSQDYASTKYDNFLSRYYDTLKPLQSLSGVGQTSAGQSAANAITTGQGVGNALSAGAAGAGSAIAEGTANAGDARASGYINQANAFQSGANNISNALMAGAYIYNS